MTAAVGAVAAEGSETTDPVADEADAIGPPSLLPPARDGLGGHVTGFVAAALAVPFGNLSEDVDQSDVAGVGWGLSLDVALGVSRAVAVGLWGQAVLYGSTDECEDCTTRSFAGGPLVRYHLVQGVRFDPWAAAGIGFRQTTIDGTAGTESYRGIEWLRMQVGGDWYALPSFGVGPFLELDLGTFFERPEGEGSAALSWHFMMGVRLGLDVPGK
jgi:hypothetical protein